MFMIGIDPHKGSHTAVAVDRTEAGDRHVPGRRRPSSTTTTVGRGRNGSHRARGRSKARPGWVRCSPSSSSRPANTWLMCHRSCRHGCGCSSAARSTRPTRTMPAPRRSSRGTHPTLNVVSGLDEHRVVLRLLADRDHQITADRTRTICRLHALLCLLIEGGTGRSLTVDRKPNELLAQRIQIDGPVTVERIIAGTPTTRRDPDVLDAARNEIPHDAPREVVRCVSTAVTEIHGIGPLTAAIIIGRVGDIRRFPTAGHFARHNGTAPIEASSGPKETAPVEPAR